MFEDTDRSFDLDHDGKLNAAEEAYKYQALEEAGIDPEDFSDNFDF